MGETYLFTCDACGYKAEASDGIDYGWMIVTATISCKGCQQLRTVTISRNRKEYVRGTRPPIRCFHSKHVVEYWEHPGPCPRCGNIMTRSEDPIIFWD